MAKEFLNQSDLAIRYDIDRMTLRARLREAGIEGTKKGRDTMYEITPELEDAILPEARADYEAERARKTKLDADLRELSYRERLGELVEKRQIQDELQTIFTKLYQKLVNQQPRELSGALYRAESPEHCQAVLMKATAKIFNDLREEHAKLIGDK